MNAFNIALGGSNEDKIYSVIFETNANGGVDVVYSIDLSLASTVNNNEFKDLLYEAIRAEPGLKPLFGKNCCFFFKHDVLNDFENNRVYKNGQNFFRKKIFFPKLAKNRLSFKKKPKHKKRKIPYQKSVSLTFVLNLIKFSKKKFFFSFFIKINLCCTRMRLVDKIGQK